ncbi:MAG TPA: fused MFS/spermidine synthase [Alphaproteobacteria bacterium]|nr:fused MFS/spermidine synthase [Alphaproteobacteria bacterium]
MGSWHYLLRAGVYANGLAIGFVLMGFEMLGSRYLNPYFGSGIVTWAALISTVLLALMVGYFLGGWLVDKTPHLRVLSVLVIVASLYLFAVPGLADATIAKLIGIAGDGATGVISASIALIFVPVTLLGTFSPFGVRLLLHTTTHSGRTTGTVYGVSTVGNIIGVMATTFILIPTIGSREITTLFAAILLASGVLLFVMDRLSRKYAL